MVGTHEDYQRATVQTQEDLHHIALTVAENLQDTDLSELSLPEIEAMVSSVAELVPAGNVPGLILNGLARLQGNQPSSKTVKRDVRMLLRGVEQVMDRAVYSAFFAGPAAVIWGYQNLLRLAGKNPDAAFPDGTWQFYVDYAMRDDTARHTNETDGFDAYLREHEIALDDVDRMTVWVMTAIQIIHQYPDLLKNEWRERVYSRALYELDEGAAHRRKYARVFQEWQQNHLPYRRRADYQTRESYPAYRHRKFDEYLINYLNELNVEHRRAWMKRTSDLKKRDLAAFQEQMGIRAHLEADHYSETRRPLPLKDIHIGVIYDRRYYLVPACQRGTALAADLETVRAQLAAMVLFPSDAPPTSLIDLARIKRSQWPDLLGRLPAEFADQLAMLQLTPIIINFDTRGQTGPLAQLRQAERGIGDHALTIFDTGKTTIFDQSHIFFDGIWGATLAEIMTNEAMLWTRTVQRMQPARPGRERPYSPPLQLAERKRKRVLHDKVMRVQREASAETVIEEMTRVKDLRQLFKQRSDLLSLTVNDLLVLYRAIHAMTYQPDKRLIADLQKLTRKRKTRPAAEAALAALQHEPDSPAIMIPVDASIYDPRQRLHPMSFEVPLRELDLIQLHQDVLAALDAYEKKRRGREAAYQHFDALQRQYLTAIASFGQVMSRAKEIANRGESASVGTIKLLAHMPPAMQRLLDSIPGRFDVLNDIIKGRETFSNIGRVVPSSTLRRFLTARDDNEKKTLAWGIVTDAQGKMHITLRDFRPHVQLLLDVDEPAMAQRITQDYLNAFATGFVAYIQQVQRITAQSRETQLIQE